MSKVVGFFGDNAGQVDASEKEKEIREEYPKLLQEAETIVLAFVSRAAKGRDSILFTTKRVVAIDKHGMTGKKTEFMSICNHNIQAFAVETGGTMDSDAELVLFVQGMAKTKLNFCKGIDVYALQRHLSHAVLTEASIGANVPTTSDNVKGSNMASGFLRWLGDDHTQMDAKKIEEELKEKQVLLDNEIVELAFKCGRDSFLLTSKRLMKINVQGMTGKKAEYFTITWPSVRAFSIETAGSFDNDTELVLFTNLDNMTRISMDFKKRMADIFAVQKFIADKLLGMDTVDPSANADAHSSTVFSNITDFISWAGDDSRMIDASKMNKQYHANPPLLQTCENVEMAFKGRRDLVLFTGKRLILVDMKGASAKKVEYLSVPWSTVQAFGVRSAGSFADKDAELMVWTDFDDTLFPPKESEDDPPPPPIPRKSYLELDFQKNKVDMMVVQRYLADRCIPVDGGGLRPNDVPVAMETSSPSGVSTFLSWLGNDSHAVDAQKLDHQLHEVNPMLRDDEHVSMAFKSGRDMTIFTTKRILIMDMHGMSGKKIEWISIPYTSLRAFSCENACGWGDRDAEMKLWCKIYWYANDIGNVIEQDFRKGKADIIEIQAFLSKQVMGSQDGSSGLDDKTRSSSGGKGGFNFLTDDGVEVNAEKVNEELRPILSDDENVDVAFRIGRRDMCIFTTKRILMIDRQGMTGKKVEYKSFPLRYCTAFTLQSGGSFLSDAEATVYMDVPGEKEIRQDLKKSGSDIWAIQSMLANKLLAKE